MRAQTQRGGGGVVALLVYSEYSHKRERKLWSVKTPVSEVVRAGFIGRQCYLCCDCLHLSERLFKISNYYQIALGHVSSWIFLCSDLL